MPLACERLGLRSGPRPPGRVRVRVGLSCPVPASGPGPDLTCIVCFLSGCRLCSSRRVKSSSSSGRFTGMADDNRARLELFRRKL